MPAPELSRICWRVSPGARLPDVDLALVGGGVRGAFRWGFRAPARREMERSGASNHLLLYRAGALCSGEACSHRRRESHSGRYRAGALRGPRRSAGRRLAARGAARGLADGCTSDPIDRQRLAGAAARRVFFGFPPRSCRSPTRTTGTSSSIIDTRKPPASRSRESRSSTTTRGCSRSREGVDPTGSDDFAAFVLQPPGFPGTMRREPLVCRA